MGSVSDKWRQLSKSPSLSDKNEAAQESLRQQLVYRHFFRMSFESVET